MSKRQVLFLVVAMSAAMLSQAVSAGNLVLANSAAIFDSVEDDDAAYAEIGTASWYGAQHQGRRTASGERFDMRKLTAAHPSLPLDTKLKVTNLANGRTVEVTVNDRGPYVGRRIIDLSARAAEELGMKRRGIGRVKIEVVGDEEGAG